LELTGKKSPGTGLEGKFSVYHSAAVAIFRGAAGLKEYSDEVVRNPMVVALRERVSVATDPGIKEEEAYITIRLKDGRDLAKHVEHAIGSLENPMGDADLEAKFRSLSEGILPAAKRDNLIRLCWAIATLKDVSVIARASAGRG
jgi:2-methylcitrate dehydratase PrpD